MIPLVLAIAILASIPSVFAGRGEATSIASKARLSLIGFACFVAASILLNALPGAVGPRNRPWQFRTGALVPTQEKVEDGYGVAIYYHEWSWWGWKKVGEWQALPHGPTEWKFHDGGGRLKTVPPSIFGEIDDTRNMESDHRGTYEAR